MRSKQKEKRTNISNSNTKKIGGLVLCALAAIAFVCLLYYANHDRPTYHSSDTTGVEYEVGKVIEVLADNTSKDPEQPGILRGDRKLSVQIRTGRYKGEVAQVENYFSSLYNVQVDKGDSVSIRIDTSDQGYQVSIYNYYRVPQLIGCVLFFAFLLIVIGGKKGAKAIAGLAFTMVSVIFILLPLTLKGFSPLLVTLVLVLLCNFVSFFLIDGICKKTVMAAVGSLCGVVAGALFSMAAQALMSVTTYQMDEAETLLLITSSTKLQLKDLFLCGILIACMGAVMDVAMSIASATTEIHKKNPELGIKDLYHSGMNVGRDAMGTMANTLILAFAGNSFNMMVMIYSYGIGFQQLMNTDFIAIEVIRSIAGSIGIVCTVPIVALITAVAYGRKDGERNA